jgi:glycerol kinase
VIEAMQRDSGIPISTLRVDGGMVPNTLLMQFQADILNVPVLRPRTIETTALGAAYAAGLAVGYWHDMDDLRHNWGVTHTWTPAMAGKRRVALTTSWRKAITRSFDWA